ncbi:MAG: 16S rRNA (uracil(1498)-N(3))-methyltransferase [Treponema sp.]|nr:16S rRNA (uracil(1498)-N(3))-methyltransferase [Treponema sp.]
MQFLLREQPDKEGIVRLKDEDYHYLAHVRRLKPGAVFQAILPQTNAGKNNKPNAQCVNITVLSIDKRTLTGSVDYIDDTKPVSKISNVTENTVLPPIIVFQALPKGTKMDLIIRQATEMGISEIVPFVSEYSVPKKSSCDKRTDRWRRIVKEARQQSLSAVNTIVHEVLNVNELFAYWDKLRNDYSEKALGLIFSLLVKIPLENGGFHRYLNSMPPLLVLAVGPEGGFSAAESDSFEKAGFKALSLGDTVLRTETAAVFGAAAAKIILMERAWWKTTPQ